MTVQLTTAGPVPDVADSFAVPFERLYSLHAAHVHRFCLSQVGDDAAEDLTHDTFLRAHAAYDRVRPDADGARTWLMSIARNLSTDHHRRVSRWRRVLDRQRREAPTPRDIADIAADRERLREVHAAIARLSRRDRELIGLRVAADLSFRDVARVVGVSEAAAKVATNRALQRLRARLATPRETP